MIVLLNVFLSALGAVMTLFAFVAGGFVFARRGSVKRDFPGQLAGVLFKFFLPLLMLKIILLQTDAAQLTGSVNLLIVSALAILAGIPLGLLATRLLRGRIAAAPSEFAMMFPNFIFMGMPVVLALLGDEAAQPLVIYSLPLNLLVSTLGYMVMDSSSKVNFRALLNPCTVSILLGFAWLALGIPVPAFVADVVTLGGNVVSPMAMFQVGMVIGNFKFESFGVLRDAALLSLARLIVLPLVTLAVLLACGLRGLSASVPAVISAMPVAANMTITAGACGKHEDVSAQLVFVSTVLSLVTIPVMAVAIEAIMGLV